MNKLRNIGHIVVGWALAHLVTQLDINDLFGKIVVGLMVAGLFGGAWETFQEHWGRIVKAGIKFNYKDALLTALGGLFGSFTAMYFDNNYLDIASWVILALGGAYLFYNVKKKRPV